ncbi:MAG: response regulator [Caulobacteraceae bacterium]|nr:response regulator [Caulobacter sp.]
MDIRPRILVVDDEPQIHRFLGPALDAAGYHPVRAETGRDGLRELAARAPDLLILDLGLPDMDGKQVLEQARRFYNGPVIILSARDHGDEKISALDLGADDYVQKPFDMGELLARLRAALRRGATQPGQAQVFRTGDLEIDLAAHSVLRGGERVRLTGREYKLLALLAKAPGRVLTHRQLAEGVWGAHQVENVQYLRVLIQHLRQKLEPSPSSPRHVLNESGVGYRLV